MTALMRNGRDRRLGQPVMGHATLERVRLFGTRSADYIRASGHNGCIATEAILQAKQAEYMTAPERFAEMPDFSLAPRAPSIHDPDRTSPLLRNRIAGHGVDVDCHNRGNPMIRTYVLAGAVLVAFAAPSFAQTTTTS
ncbi:MAG: hypothetical protein ACSLFK_06275, partial [Gemmatimonadaceae bacterium]